MLGLGATSPTLYPSTFLLGHAILITPAACCFPKMPTMLLLQLCWLFPLPRILFPQIHSRIPPSLPSGLYSERLALVPLRKQHSVPLLSFIFLHSTHHHRTFYIYSFVYCVVLSHTPPGWKVSSHSQRFCLLCSLLRPQHLGQYSAHGRRWHICWYTVEWEWKGSHSEQENDMIRAEKQSLSYTRIIP